MLRLPTYLAALALSAAPARGERIARGAGHGVGHEVDQTEKNSGTSNRSLVVPREQLWLHVSVMVALSERRPGLPGKVGDPLSVNPDLRYGLAEGVEIGLFHSPEGLTGFWDPPGGGLCLLGNSCFAVYGGPVGLFGGWQIQGEGLQVALGGGLLYRKFGSAALLSGQLGVALRQELGAFAVGLEPALRVGFNERQESVPPNAEQLFVPLTLRYAATRSLELQGQSGVRGFVVDFDKNYAIPASLGLSYRASARVQLSVRLSLFDLAGADGGWENRGASVGLAYRGR